ncbi:MAG: hypothetical protein JHC95_05135 [Solirubrobacteraceae bacterium]|nr:hypothetical protein [Solirubrobacteraceae bacterium]
MPLRKLHLLTATVSATLAFAAPAVAATCEQAPTTKAFAQYGDSADYSVAPGGTFEAGAPGWELYGWARIVSGNEYTGVTEGKRALQLGPGGVAISPEFCVDPSNPHFRYMSKTIIPAGTLSTLLDVHSQRLGWLRSLHFSTLNFQYLPIFWLPSARNDLGSAIPSVSVLGNAVSVRLIFRATQGVYNIDSVMVDPYRVR